ncbi:MAG: copper chaperone PCu(A)C [Anaerolineae bacterium]|nr:copper chaperone PCu(A)C [Anaerolineae bacterium]
MRRFFQAVLLLLGTLLVTSSVSAQANGDIYIIGAWARATTSLTVISTGGQNIAVPESTAEVESENVPDPGIMQMDAVSAVYMTIENHTDRTLSLIGASSPYAGAAEIHESTIDDNDVMRMRPVEGGIVIVPEGSAALEPGGYHIMLLDLQTGLIAGEALSVTLTFAVMDEQGAATGETIERTVGVPIRDEAPSPSDFVVLDAWARPTASGEMSMGGGSGIDPSAPKTDAAATEEASDSMAMDVVSAVYMRVLNRSGSDERIIAASSPVAGMVEIHESVVDDHDVMRMRPVEVLPLSAGAEAVLEPGGNHIMLMNIQRDLLVGDALMLSLTLESGAEIQVAVPVVDPLAGGS